MLAIIILDDTTISPPLRQITSPHRQQSIKRAVNVQDAHLHGAVAFRHSWLRPYRRPPLLRTVLIIEQIDKPTIHVYISPFLADTTIKMTRHYSGQTKQLKCQNIASQSWERQEIPRR